MARHSVELRHIFKSFPSNGGQPLSVLENVSLSVGTGRFCSILGPSGCGKTTLLRIIAGVEDPDSGEVLVGSGDRRSALSLVYQQNDLLPWLTVQGNLEVALKSRGHGKKARAAAADRYLRKVGLGEFGRFYPSQISGGMQKRASLARALAADSDVLLLDEPLAFLDFQTKATLQALIGDIFLRHGKTMIYVTHDIYEALRLSQEIVILSAQPARIRSRLQVDFDYPRDLEGLRKSARYSEMVDEIEAIMNEEALRTEELERLRMLQHER